MKAKFINEKFEEESDPITDLRVGGVTFNYLFKRRRTKLKNDRKKLLENSNKSWELYLKKIIIGKTITANMLMLPSFDKNMNVSKNYSGGEKSVTIKVIDIVGEDRTVYKYSVRDKMYIR